MVALTNVMPFEDFKILTRVGLRQVRRRCQRDGHQEHVDIINEALADDDAVALASLEVRRLRGGDDISLASDRPLLDILDWFLENQDAIIAFLKALFAFGV